MIMPAAPASLSTLPFSMSGFWPRRHSTTLPFTFDGSTEPGRQSSELVSATPAAGTLLASTIRVGDREPVHGTFATVNGRSSPFASLTWRLPSNVRSVVAAATEVTQGAPAGEPMVPGFGPSLPVEVATKMPASDAYRKAISSGSTATGEGEPTE